MNKPKEADIIIGGVKLSHDQALTVRVAIGGMMISLRDNEVAKSMGEHGNLYMSRLTEIEDLIFKSIRADQK